MLYQGVSQPWYIYHSLIIFNNEIGKFTNDILKVQVNKQDILDRLNNHQKNGGIWDDIMNPK